MKFLKTALLLLISAAIGLTGCAGNSALLVPPSPSPERPIEAPQKAKLRIPIVIILPNLQQIETHLADALKEDEKSVSQELTKKFGTKVWWDPLDWKFKDTHMTAKMHLHYQGKANSAEAEAAEEAIEKHMHTSVGSALKWKGWHVEAPDFEENTVEAEVDTEAKKGEKLLRKGTSKFNEDLKKISEMENKFKETWDQLQEPILLGDGVWLQVLPDHLSVGDTRIIPDPKNPRMETVFELFAVPRVVIGDKPETKKVKLPPLQDYIPGGEGFHIVTNLKIKFDQVNSLLMAPKTGIVNMALPGGEDYNVRLKSVRIYGAGEKVVVEAKVDYSPLLNLSKEPAHLTVYLLGTPTYHEKTQTIDFPDMDFDIKSSDFLVQMVDFLDGDGIKAALRKNAVIPVGKDLNTLRKQLDKMLNRKLNPHMALKINITSMKLTEAYVSSYGIEGRVAIDGDGAVDLSL
ncbi:MAG TPA: DUF4403 family protein [bacterium]|jgi:hypothetical protein|nr:DUF4403 family protein [bacterium]